MELNDYLSQRPKTATNWRGVQQDIEWPSGKTIARCGDVFMIKRPNDKFAIVYGLQVHDHLEKHRAAREFGECCLHQANTLGLIQ